MNLLFSLTLVAISGALLILGFDAAEPLAVQISQLFSGHPSSRTMWLIVGGCACLVVGLVGCYRSRVPDAFPTIPPSTTRNGSHG